MNKTIEWKKDFKKEFDGEFCDGQGNGCYYEMESKLFDFIDNLLTSDHAYLSAEIGSKKEKMIADQFETQGDLAFYLGKNAGLETAIQIIEGEK